MRERGSEGEREIRVGRAAASRTRCRYRDFVTTLPHRDVVITLLRRDVVITLPRGAGDVITLPRDAVTSP